MIRVCAMHPEMELPVLTAASVLAYISPSRGFGAFAATDIRKDTDTAQLLNPRRTSVCVGTYGGVVCTFDEIRRHNYAYQMSDGYLPTLMTRHTIEYALTAILHVLHAATSLTWMRLSFARETADSSTAVVIPPALCITHTTWPLTHVPGERQIQSTPRSALCDRSSPSSRQSGMSTSFGSFVDAQTSQGRRRTYA